MPTRRRIDQILDDEFLADVESADLDELRERRRVAQEVENELSYYRRLLHGRADLLAFEQRRRSGEESGSLIDSLAKILADPSHPESDESRPGHIVTDLPPLPDVGRREIDFILGDDVLARADEVDEGDLQRALDAIAAIESEISSQRQRVQEVVDRLTAEIGARYKNVGS